MSEKVLCAMSGGVDSSAAALFLLEKGYDVTGLTLRLASEGEKDIADAADVCRKIGIPHIALDMRAEFERLVERPFCEAYISGETPNPCVICNKYIKFGLLLGYADENGFERIATGHYASIAEYNGHTLIRRADDKKKDQSYVLWQLPESTVKRAIFPLASMTKPEVRDVSADHGFENAYRSDSQDICFVPDGDYVAFIERLTGYRCESGNFIDREGNILGTHRGNIRYTVGQRKGLGISLGEPAYVLCRNASDNSVTLGRDEDLFRCEITLHDSRVSEAFPLLGRFDVKIRYAHRASPATVTDLGGGRLRVEFDEPQRAPAKGQSAVLYSGDLLCGGGFIE